MINDFEGIHLMVDISIFSFPTTVCFGPAAIKDLAENLKEIGISKPLLVTDNGLIKTDAFKSVEKVLKDNGVSYVIFSDINPNPFIEDVEKAAEAYKANNCNGVIGLGGGSALDAAKIVPVEVCNPGPLTKYNIETGGNANIKGPLPPVIAVPTTAGTGSEVGRCSVITDPIAGKKFLVCHPQMMPRIAVLDPELTVGLPPILTASTGMDAFVHNLEAFTVDMFPAMCDAIALKGIEYVAKYLERAVKTPSDIEARGHMMIAAMMGAVAFQKDLGAAHSLAHPLSTECGVQHGLANAVCIIPVMEFNKEVVADKYAKVAGCFEIDTRGLSNIEAADKAIEAVDSLGRRIGIPSSLAQVGVKEEQLPLLAKKAFEDSCHLTNPKPCTQKDLLMLYEQAFARS